MPRVAANVTSAAKAPRAGPARAAAPLTSSNSASVSENCTTFGRDTASRDRRLRISPGTTITPDPWAMFFPNRDRARSHGHGLAGKGIAARRFLL